MTFPFSVTVIDIVSVLVVLSILVWVVVVLLPVLVSSRVSLPFGVISFLYLLPVVVSNISILSGFDVVLLILIGVHAALYSCS